MYNISYDRKRTCSSEKFHIKYFMSVLKTILTVLRTICHSSDRSEGWQGWILRDMKVTGQLCTRWFLEWGLKRIVPFLFNGYAFVSLKFGIFYTKEEAFLAAKRCHYLFSYVVLSFCKEHNRETDQYFMAHLCDWYFELPASHLKIKNH